MNIIDRHTSVPDEASMRRMEEQLFERIDSFELTQTGALPDHQARASGGNGHGRRRPRTIAPTRPSGPRGRSRVRWLGAGSIGAFAIITALVLSNVVGLAGWRGGADPAAAAVLERAASRAHTMTDPIVGDGDYLEITTTRMNVNYFDGVPYAATIDDQMYVPKDRSDDWVWIRPMSKPYATFGDESARASEKYFAAIYGEHGADYVEKLRAPAGRWYGGDSQVSPDALAALPTDPRMLLNHVYLTTIGSGPSADGEALVFIADRLRSGAIPADVRAALYQAAALIPGVEVVDAQATLDGRTGTAIGRVEKNGGFRQDIILDPDSGLFIGERTTQLSASNTIPAGTITSWSTVTTSVVDAAPAGGTVNGAFDEMGCVTENGHSVCPN